MSKDEQEIGSEKEQNEKGKSESERAWSVFMSPRKQVGCGCKSRLLGYDSSRFELFIPIRDGEL